MASINLVVSDFVVEKDNKLFKVILSIRNTTVQVQKLAFSLVQVVYFLDVEPQFDIILTRF